MKYLYIDGRKWYRSMTEIKDSIDVAIPALPASKVMGRGNQSEMSRVQSLSVRASRRSGIPGDGWKKR